MAPPPRLTWAKTQVWSTQIKRDFLQSPISDKLKALLVIAGQVQQDGKQVTAESVENARKQRGHRS